MPCSLIYPVHHRLMSLNLSHATTRIPNLGKMIRHSYKLQRLWVLDFIEDTGHEEIAELEELRVFSSDPYVQEPNVSLTE